MNEKQVSILTIIGLFIILGVSANQMIGVNNYRNLLEEYSDYDLIMLTNDSVNKVELLGRSYDESVEFYRWSFKDGKLKTYAGSDLIDTSYWQLFKGSKGIWFNKKQPIEFNYNNKQTNITMTIDYYLDSRHKNYVGRLVRVIEVYPAKNKETVLFYPEDNETKYLLKWIHETDHYGVSKDLKGYVRVDLDKMQISWEDSLDQVSWARQYLNGKIKVGYKSAYGNQTIDPQIKIGKYVINYKLANGYGGIDYTPQCFMGDVCHLPIEISINKDLELKPHMLKGRFKKADKTFKDLKKKGLNIYRNYTEEIKTWTSDITCINETLENGTVIQNCTDNGYYVFRNVTKQGWTKVNFPVRMKADKKYIIDLWGIKNKHEDLDAVFLINGIETHELAWWNDSWNYKKEIQIDGTGLEIPIDYQLLINVSHVTGKMNSTFKDIRFTDDSENVLAYWIEKNVSNDYAEVWVKGNISNSTNTTWWMYYGNDVAETTSNATNTMSFFDNFDDLDSTSNPTWTPISGTWTGSNGYLSNSVNGNKCNVSFDGLTSKNMIYEWDFYISGYDISHHSREQGYTYFTMNDSDNSYYFLKRPNIFGKKIGGVATTMLNLADEYFYPFTGWASLKIIKTSTKIQFWIKKDTWSNVGNYTESDDFIPDEIYLMNLGDSNYNRNNRWDNFKYRRYVEVLPIYSFGADQGQNTPLTITANATSPSVVYENTDWLVNLTITDPDSGDTLTGYVQFYKNDAQVGGEYSTEATNNTNTLIATLGSGNYTCGDNLTAEFWAGDGTENTSKSNMTVTVSEIRIIGSCTTIYEGGKTYQMNQSIIDSTTSECITINANNVILDCAGYTIDGNDAADTGIYVYRQGAETTNITIKNCTITDWDTNGISIHYANGNNLTNLTVNSNPDYGILIQDSNSNTFTSITANSNYYGIYSSYSDSNTFTNITVKNNFLVDFYHQTTRATLDCNLEFVNVIGTEDKPILFYNSSVNIQDWNNNVSEIILCGADNSNVSNLIMDKSGTENNGFFLIATQGANISNSQFMNAHYGIFIHYSNSNTFTNITANSNDYGIISEYSDSNTFTNITANTNDFGLELIYSNSNTVTNATTTTNTLYGVSIDGNSNTINESTMYSQSGTDAVGLFIDDDDNLIYNNTIYSNYYGIQLDTTATNNTLYNNTIYSNTYGIYINGAGGGEVNLIYNNLFNQTDNVKFGTVYANNWNTTKQTGTRIYSNGTQIGGNYWTNSTGNDYSDTCNDSNTDGFCDDYYNLANGNIDWLPLSDEYVSITPPNCTFISQSPADINTSSIGSITILYNCSDTDGLNDSSILIATTVNHTTENNLNFSWRFPSNTKAGGAYNEQRAEHRNESKWFESLFDNIWEWSVHDCSCGHLTCSSNGSGWKVYNFTKPDVRGLFHQFFPLDKTTLESTGIDTLSYYNNNPAITEIHYRDLEPNSTMQVLFYIDGTNSNKDSLIYYCNETKKTDGLSISDSTNCVYLGNIETTDSYSYTRSNVSYYELNFYIDENETIGTVKVTEISYFGFVTTANAVKNWDLKYSDDTTLIGNISMNTSGMLYTSSDDGATFTQHSGTGVVWLSEIHDNIDEITYKIYACDNLSNCGWSSVTTDEIGVIQYAPGKPQIIHINGDKNKNGTYSSTIDIGCLLGKDANGDVVTGNLTLRNTDGTFNYTINGSFSDGGLEINISFDTSLVDDGIYKLNLTNCDTTSRCSSNLLNENFTIDNGIPDLDCSLGSGISQIVYRPLIDLDNPPTNSNWLWVNASGQTNSIPLINCTNNGSATGQVQMNTSLAYQNIVDSCADNNAYTSHINLTQTFQNIGSTVAPGGTFQVWCKRGYNSSVFTMGGFDYGLTINSI